MIGKISQGADFHGLLAYLLKHGRGVILDTIHLSSTDPCEVAGEMTLASMMSRRVRKPVLHCSISYGPGEEPTDAEMRVDGRAVLKSLGLEDNQAIIIRHQDRDHTHFHIAANRVGSDGCAVHDGQSFARLESALRDIEHQRGWQPVPGRNAPGPDGHRFHGTAQRPDPRQVAVPATVRAALLDAKSWKELRQRLQAEGWRLDVKTRPGQRAGALLVGPRGEKIGAGKVDRAATLSHLHARLSPSPRTLIGKAQRKKTGRNATAIMLAALAEAVLAPTLGMSGLGRRRKLGLGAAASQIRRRHIRSILRAPNLKGPRI